MAEKVGALRPSGAKQWLLCPGAPAAQEGYPDEESPAAAEGTRAHTLLEHCLQNGVPPSSVPQIKEEDGTQWEVSQDMAAYVQSVLDYVWAKGPDVKIYSEIKVDASPFVGLPAGTLAGTCDVAIISGNNLEIVDLKYGMGVYVEHENNPQMLIYAAGVVSLFDATVFDTITITIAQPRYVGAEPVRSKTYVFGDFKSLVGEIGIGAVKALSPSAKRNPGEEQCRWCRAKGDCQARIEKVSEVTQKMFKPVHEAVDKGENISGEALAEFMDQIPLIKNMIKDVEAEVYKRLNHGQSVPGYKLIEGRSKREWKDAGNAAKKIKAFKVGGKALGIDVVMPRSIISPAQAEKIPNLTKQHLDTIKRFIVKTPGKPVVAPESNPKPAIMTNVQFNPVEQKKAAPVEIPDFM